MPSKVPEDKLILAAMNSLQRLWRNELTDTNRANWRAYWEDHPPTDIALRTYVTRDVIAWDEVKVTEARLYAWTMIYGFYRFKQPALHDPATFEDRRPVITVASMTNDALTLKIVYTPRPTESARLIPFASDLRTTPGPPNRYNLRPLCAFNCHHSDVTINAEACYIFRFGHDTFGSIDLTCALVDSNNMLQPSPTIETFNTGV